MWVLQTVSELALPAALGAALQGTEAAAGRGGQSPCESLPRGVHLKKEKPDGRAGQGYGRGLGTASLLSRSLAQYCRRLKNPTLVGDSLTVTVIRLAVTSVTKTCSIRLRVGFQSWLVWMETDMF